MSEQEEGYEVYDSADLGVQDDGEPIAVAPVEDKPEEVPEKVEAESEEEESEEEVTPKKKSGSQRAREKAQRLEIEVQLLKEQLAGKKTAGDEPKQKAESVVKAEDFETHEDYIVARAKHELRSEMDAAKVKATWDAKVEAGNEQFEDFQEALESADAPSNLVAKRLVNPKTPVEVVYHLATHPKEYKAINALTDPDDVADAMAELKARLAAPKEPAKPKPTTKAPAPMAPTRGSAVAVQDEEGYQAY